MNTLRNSVLWVLLSCCLPTRTLYGSIGYLNIPHQKPASIEIHCSEAKIHIGEPLFLKVTLHFNKPLRNADTDDIQYQTSRELLILSELKDKDREWLAKYPDFTPFETGGIQFYPADFKITSATFDIQDEQGLAYSTYFIIAYHPLKKDYVFSEPGAYRLCVRAADGNLFSNVIKLEVDSKTTENVCMLSDPNDYRFLMSENSNLYKDADSYAKTISNLKNILEQYPNHMLGKLAAARLGIESQRVDEIEGSKAMQEKREPSWVLFEEAKMYYQKALGLPDDYPVREQILWQLAEFEMLNENYQQALSYAAELEIKYPKGRYGRHAAEAISEITAEAQKSKQREPGPR